MAAKSEVGVRSGPGGLGVVGMPSVKGLPSGGGKGHPGGSVGDTYQGQPQGVADGALKDLKDGVDKR